MGRHLLRRTCYHDPAPIAPCARTEIYHVVGCFKEVQIVFDDQDGVLVAELSRPLIICHIAGVTDCRLIQDIYILANWIWQQPP
jgi:hypothetical protein